MRRISILSVCLGIVLWSALSAWTAHAQNGGLPPAIVQFTCDHSSVALADVEAGTALVTFTWQTVGVTGQQHVALYQDQRGWDRIDDPNHPLPASGTVQIPVEHPANFAPPAYRLAIEDSGGTLLDEWLLTLAYEDTPGTPAIASFGAAAASVDINQITGGKAYIGVTWDVTHRQPMTSLVFEQVLPDGSTASAELTRTNQWTASKGSGTLQLAFSRQDQPLQVRLRIVDLRSGQSLADASLSLPITGTLVPTPVPTQAPPPVSSGPQVILFTVNPPIVNLGDSVTVQWQVVGATSVGINEISLDGPIIGWAPNAGLSGTWTAPINWYYRAQDTAFTLYAQDAAGHTVTQNLGVTVRCPATFFFQETSGYCPTGPATQVQAAYQTFEHGFMVWWGDTKKIMVFYGGGPNGALDTYQDLWAGEDIVIADTPPAGLIAPQRGFGKVWTDNSGVRSALGWATSQEQSYTLTTQTRGGNRYAPIYFTLPDGRIVSQVWNSWSFYTR